MCCYRETPRRQEVAVIVEGVRGTNVRVAEGRELGIRTPCTSVDRVRHVVKECSEIYIGAKEVR